MRNFKMMGLIFLLVMVIIAVFGYQHYNSPSYALTRIVRAVEAHDQRNFDKYVDRETLSTNLADDLVNFTSSMIERKQQKESGGQTRKSAQANMARMMAEAMKPKMIEEIDQAILKLIEIPDSTAEAESNQKKKRADIMGLLSLEGDFTSIDPSDVIVEAHGDSAYIAAMSDKKEGKEPSLLTGTMKKQDGTWRLIDINYLEYILTKHGLGETEDEKNPENK